MWKTLIAPQGKARGEGGEKIALQGKKRGVGQTAEILRRRHGLRGGKERREKGEEKKGSLCPVDNERRGRGPRGPLQLLATSLRRSSSRRGGKGEKGGGGSPPWIQGEGESVPWQANF